MQTSSFLIASLIGMACSAACGSPPAQPSVIPAATPPATTPPAVLTAVHVVGPSRVSPAEPAQYTARAEYSDGSSKDVTALAAWTPQGAWNPMYFISPGVAMGVKHGEYTVAARYLGTSGAMHILVLEPGTFKLSGTVVESSGRPLPAVAIDVVCGSSLGLQATSNLQGQYALYGVSGPIQLRVAGTGFLTQMRDTVITADGAIDAFVLTPTEAPLDVSGTWTMTLAPSPSCRNGLPEIARDRRYQVQLIQQGTGLRVKISSPTLAVLAPDEDYGTIFGSQLLFYFVGDSDYGDWSFADLNDHLSQTEILGFDGTVQARVTGPQIDATMSGDLMYWNAQPPAYPPAWYCRALDHIVTLRR